MAVANEAGACTALAVRRLGDRNKRGRARPHRVAARRQFVLFGSGHGEIRNSDYWNVTALAQQKTRGARKNLQKHRKIEAYGTS
jgi:hypothetical protein